MFNFLQSVYSKGNLRASYSTSHMNSKSRKVYIPLLAPQNLYNLRALSKSLFTMSSLNRVTADLTYATALVIPLAGPLVAVILLLFPGTP